MTWHRTTIQTHFLSKLATALGPCANCTQRRMVATAPHIHIPHGLYRHDEFINCES